MGELWINGWIFYWEFQPGKSNSQKDHADNNYAEK